MTDSNFTPYAEDDPVWDADLTDDDVRRVIMEVVGITVKDEIGNGLIQTSTEKSAHSLYLRRHDGLMYDCMLLGLSYSAVMKAMGLKA